LARCCPPLPLYDGFAAYEDSTACRLSGSSSLKNATASAISRAQSGFTGGVPRGSARSLTSSSCRAGTCPEATASTIGLYVGKTTTVSRVNPYSYVGVYRQHGMIYPTSALVASVSRIAHTANWTLPSPCFDCSISAGIWLRTIFHVLKSRSGGGE